MTTQTSGLTVHGTLQLTESGHVPIEYFCKDHWSLLGYIGARMDSHKAGNAEGIAALDLRQLRCNPERHPMHAVNGKEWRDAWGSRLKGFWNPNHPNERFDEWQIPEHDDLDCLDDLEAAGLITVYSGANVFVGINEGRGMEVYVQLHKHKISGGMFANFEPQL